MEMWRKEKSSNSEESPEILLKKAKDALLAFRWKGMYERKKRIEELKKLSVNQQNLRRIFDLLVELEYLRPPGVKGGPPRGDDFEQIKPERLTKAIENAKSETDNDYPEYMEQMLADPQCDLDCFKRNAKIALRKVFVKNAYDSSGIIPYGEYTDAAIRKFIRYAGKRRVTSHVQVKSHKGKDVRSLYELKAKPWNWPWLTNSEKIDDPQEIKKAIQQRLGRASDSLKSDDQYSRKEKTIGLGVGEVGDFDPIKLVGSREKSPKMSIVDIDRSEKLEMIRSSVQDAFFDLYKHNSNMFFDFATTLGLEYDQSGKVSIPYDISPLYKELKKGESSKTFSDDVILQKLKEKGQGEGLDENKIAKLRREANNFIKNRLMQDLAHLGLRTLRSESTFSEWLLFNY